MSLSKERAKDQQSEKSGGRKQVRERRTEVGSFSPVGRQWYANVAFPSGQTPSPNEIGHEFG